MSTLKVTMLIGLLLTIGFEAAGQEKSLNLKARFSYKLSSSIPANVSKTEINRLLAKKGYIVEDKVYSQNGRIEARIEPPINYNSEFYDYEAYFSDITTGASLGRFKLTGELFPANDGKHFVTFSIHGGGANLYSFASQQPLRVMRAEMVKLSEDGSKVLVASNKEHSIELNCFRTSGEEVWSTQIPYTNIAEIAISYNGNFAALSAYLLDPQNIEKQKEVSETIAEAKRQWAETNRQRRAQNLPEIPFKPPVFPGLEKKKVSDKQSPSRALIFFGANGSEIGRTEPGHQAFLNLTFSRGGGTYCIASKVSEIYLFNAANAIVLQKKALEFATEINSLDVSQNGVITIAAITHPIRDHRGWALDRGLEDPRIAILWNTLTSEMRTYQFEGGLQIPRDQFFVSLNEMTDKFLTQAGDQIFVFEK